MPDEISAADPPPEANEPAPLTLREPLPDVIDSPAALERTVDAVADGTGPIALDAERASGYRYSPRAYLVQLRREGTGTALIDPMPFDDLAALDAAIGDTEWILHAAIQDLPCLTELGMRPRSLFDTELAGRLLNLPRVGLATLVSDLLGWSMTKAHSAVDWSTRPLPEPWLEYAALDVEMLLELREAMAERLENAGKLDWAREEFESLLDYRGPMPRAEPWRRTSGIHRVRGRRALAVVRSLWVARDGVAQERDVAPGRILPDAVIIEVARSSPKDGRALRSMPTLRARRIRRDLPTWVSAVDEALGLPDGDLPTATARSNGPPPPRAWADRDPDAADRLTACRTVVTELSKSHEVPAENLIAPDLIRRLAWEPPADPDPPAIAAALADGGARPWQVGLIAAPLAEALTASDS
ncbi:MAG TPA: ribonuclease D [Nocardioidaceae bacterium]|nr:ribonuclease D [Nocardioidaceae bacterium]